MFLLHLGKHKTVDSLGLLGTKFLAIYLEYSREKIVVKRDVCYCIN